MNFWCRCNAVYDRPRGMSSWGIAVSGLIKALRQLGHNVAISVIEGDCDVPNLQNAVQIQLTEPWVVDPAHKTLVNIGYYIWACEHVEPEWIDKLKFFDALVCPSQEALRIWKRQPVGIPLGILPHGYDEETFYYIDRNWDDIFTFLHLGVPQFKKGGWLLYDAFQKAFDGVKDVRLVTKSGSWRGQFDDFKEQSRNDDRLIFDDRPLMHEEIMAMIVPQCHCLVTPTLFEVWNSSVPEMMATGMGVITSRNSGMLDYFSDEYGYFLNLSNDFVPNNYPDINGYWQVPDIDHLIYLMRYVYEHRDDVATKGKKASDVALQQLTYKAGLQNTFIPFLRETFKEVL